jgi:hypothetical protein
MTAQRLTDSERRTLEHLKRAQQSGSTLSDYAASRGVSAQSLYNGKSQLRRKGLWPQTSAPAQIKQAELLEVRVLPERAASEAPVLRLSTPGGWNIECSHWPEVQWLTALLNASGSAR